MCATTFITIKFIIVIYYGMLQKTFRLSYDAVKMIFVIRYTSGTCFNPFGPKTKNLRDIVCFCTINTGNSA